MSGLSHARPLAISRSIPFAFVRVHNCQRPFPFERRPRLVAKCKSKLPMEDLEYLVNAGTAKYKALRARVIRQAQADGLTHCPGFEDVNGNLVACGKSLDYVNGLRPNSAEADHVLPVRFGGTDSIENLRVLCRSCNLKRNRKVAPKAITPLEAFPTSRVW